MTITRTFVHHCLAAALALLVGACGSGAGPDAISSHKNVSSPQTCTSSCHNAQSTLSPDPVRTNSTGTAGKHSVHVSSQNIICETCHYQYFDQASHFNGTLDTGKPALPVVNINVSGVIGTWTNTAGPGSGNCSSVACHGPAVLDWYGIGGLPDCAVCHTGALDPIVINGSGTDGKHAKHVGSSNIPCIKCHANYPDNPGHMLATYSGTTPASMVSFDATNPTGTYSTGSSGGTCASLACHAQQSVDWYGTAGWTTPSCTTCHDSTIGIRRQVLGSGGDFNLESHHVISYASRTVQIVTDPDCLVCHHMSQHMSGSVRLKNADTGTALLYSASSPSTLEPFCLSCHDANGAAGQLSPFSDGNTLGAGRNVAGSRIASAWTSSSTAHKANGLTCAGTGAPNTGCHGNNRSINMHGSPTRGLLTQNMTNPIPATQAYNYHDYRLCFDCHASYPAVTKEVVLGVKLSGNYDVTFSPGALAPFITLPATPYYTAGIQSQFRDRYIQGDPRPYNDIISLFNGAYEYAYMQLHNLHLLGIYYDPNALPLPNWFSWRYRGDASQPGRITCTSCHNVHGTTNAVRNAHDELQLTPLAGTSPDRYTQLPISAATASVMQSSPMNCMADCHGIQGSTSYWHTPANE